MKYWKITNTSLQPVKIVCKLHSNASKGIILKPNEFCIAAPQMTAPIDAQERRGFITVEADFDNSEFDFKPIVAYHIATLEIKQKSKLEIAKKKIEKYIDNE